MIKFPPALVKGDCIGIICPAGYMAKEKAETCIEMLKNWGYTVKTGVLLGEESDTYFSGTDQQRMQELQTMLDDDSIKAILCARGGYGVSRIIDGLNFTAFKKHPKWIIGFSDITLLHSHIFNVCKVACIHAPMAAAFNDGGAVNEYVLSLKKMLSGKKNKYTCSPETFNILGKATGQLVGGNLSLLVHGIGTKSAINTINKILFLEDTGEYIYAIDRMFYQLKRSGKLDGLAGLVIGGFTDIKDTARPFGKSVYAAIKDILIDVSFPVCFGFPVSHGTENYALKIGAPYMLEVNKNKVSLSEQ